MNDHSERIKQAEEGIAYFSDLVASLEKQLKRAHASREEWETRRKYIRTAMYNDAAQANP